MLLRCVRQRSDISSSHDEQTSRVEILLANEHLEPVRSRSFLTREDGSVVCTPVGEILGTGEHRTDRTPFATGFPELVAVASRWLVLLPLLVEFPDRFVRMRQHSLAVAYRAFAEDTESLGASFDQDPAVDGVVSAKTASVLVCIDLLGSRDVAVLAALPSLTLFPGVGEVLEAALIDESLHFVLRDLVVPCTTPILKAVEVVGDLLGCGVLATSVTEVACERAWIGIDVPFPNPVEWPLKIQRHALQCSMSHWYLLIRLGCECAVFEPK